MSNYKNTNSNNDWRNALLRKTWIAIVVILILGALPFIYKLWPGCLVSLIMLGGAISLWILSYHIINLREEEHPRFKRNLESNLKNILNFAIIWSVFFFVCGLICLFVDDCKWWVWTIIVYLGSSGSPFITMMMLNLFEGKEEI